MKDRMLLVLMAGQSNMAGRGIAGPDDLVAIPGVLSFRPDGSWGSAIEPVTRDRPFVGTFDAAGNKVVSPDPWDNILPPAGGRVVGVGCGRTFGRLLREVFPDRTVGLIPAAVGGTSAAAWKPGGEDDHQPGRHPYDEAVRMAKAARKSGKIVAVLWHQGENDARKNNPHYLDDLREIVTNFRRDLELGDDVPFIAGELADFYKPEIQDHVRIVDDALYELEREFAFFRVVPLKGLPHKGDHLHFSAEAQHEYGRRCFAEFRRFREGEVWRRER